MGKTKRADCGRTGERLFTTVAGKLVIAASASPLVLIPFLYMTRQKLAATRSALRPRCESKAVAHGRGKPSHRRPESRIERQAVKILPTAVLAMTQRLLNSHSLIG
jgi:hypothetical protein